MSAPMWLNFQCSEHPYLQHALERTLELGAKLGDAFIIAGILAIIVDVGSKTRLVQEVVQAASPKLLARHLPDVVQDSLVSYFKIDFIRPEWEIEYEIIRAVGYPEILEITSRVKGVIHNCSPKAEQFNFLGSVDSSFVDPAIGCSRIVRVGMAAESGNAIFDVEPKDQAALLQADGTVLYQQMTTLAAGGRYTTVFECIEYRPLSHSLPLFTSTTVVKALVRIRYPKDLLKVSLQIPSGDTGVLKTDETQWGTEWAINSPLLPGQCIIATWSPRPARPAESTFVGKDDVANARGPLDSF